MTSQRQDPSDFLKQIIGRPVVVKLNSGVDYRGTVSRHERPSGNALISGENISKSLEILNFHAES